MLKKQGEIVKGNSNDIMKFISATGSHLNATLDMFAKEYLPTSSNILKDSKDVFADVKKFVKETPSGLVSTVKETCRLSVFKDIFNWYTDTSAKYDTNINSIGDTELNFDSGVNLDIPDVSDDDSSKDSTKSTLTEMSKNSDKVASTVLESSRKLAEVQVASLSAMTNLMEKTNSLIASGFEKVNASIKELTSIVTKNTATLIQVASIGKEVKNNNSSSSKYGSDDDKLFDYNYLINEGFSLKKYADYVKRNMNRNGLGVVSAGLGMLQQNLTQGGPAALLKGGLDLLATHFAPEIKKSLKGVDDGIQSFIKTTLIDLGRGKLFGKKIDLDMGFFNLTDLLKAFGVRPDSFYAQRISRSSFEHKAISFDTETKESIVKVIPGYLREISKALTGVEKFYNIDTRSWQTKQQAIDFIQREKNNANSGISFGSMFNKLGMNNLSNIKPDDRSNEMVNFIIDEILNSLMIEISNGQDIQDYLTKYNTVNKVKTYLMDRVFNDDNSTPEIQAKVKEFLNNKENTSKIDLIVLFIHQLKLNRDVQDDFRKNTQRSFERRTQTAEKLSKTFSNQELIDVFSEADDSGNKGLQEYRFKNMKIKLDKERQQEEINKLEEAIKDLRKKQEQFFDQNRTTYARELEEKEELLKQKQNELSTYEERVRRGEISPDSINQLTNSNTSVTKNTRKGKRHSASRGSYGGYGGPDEDLINSLEELDLDGLIKDHNIKDAIDQKNPNNRSKNINIITNTYSRKGHYLSPLGRYKYKISSFFGPRMLRGKPNNHTGIDLSAPGGTEITAPSDGEIVENLPSSRSNGYGNFLAYLDKSGKMFFGFGHMSKPSTLRIGSRIKQGDTLGYVGSTGNAYGNHLHFEVLKRLNSNKNYWGSYTDGSFINPMGILNDQYGVDESSEQDVGGPQGSSADTLLAILRSPGRVTKEIVENKLNEAASKFIDKTLLKAKKSIEESTFGKEMNSIGSRIRAGFFGGTYTEVKDGKQITMKVQDEGVMGLLWKNIIKTFNDISNSSPEAQKRTAEAAKTVSEKLKIRTDRNLEPDDGPIIDRIISGSIGAMGGSIVGGPFGLLIGSILGATMPIANIGKKMNTFIFGDLFDKKASNDPKKAKMGFLEKALFNLVIPFKLEFKKTKDYFVAHFKRSILGEYNAIKAGIKAFLKARLEKTFKWFGDTPLGRALMWVLKSPFKILGWVGKQLWNFATGRWIPQLLGLTARGGINVASTAARAGGGVLGTFLKFFGGKEFREAYNESKRESTKEFNEKDIRKAGYHLGDAIGEAMQGNFGYAGNFLDAFFHRRGQINWLWGSGQDREYIKQEEQKWFESRNKLREVFFGTKITGSATPLDDTAKNTKSVADNTKEILNHLEGKKSPNKENNSSPNQSNQNNVSNNINSQTQNNPSNNESNTLNNTETENTATLNNTTNPSNKQNWFDQTSDWATNKIDEAVNFYKNRKISPKGFVNAAKGQGGMKASLFGLDILANSLGYVLFGDDRVNNQNSQSSNNLGLVRYNPNQSSLLSFAFAEAGKSIIDKESEGTINESEARNKFQKTISLLPVPFRKDAMVAKEIGLAVMANKKKSPLEKISEFFTNLAGKFKGTNWLEVIWNGFITLPFIGFAVGGIVSWLRKILNKGYEQNNNPLSPSEIDTAISRKAPEAIKKVSSNLVFKKGLRDYKIFAEANSSFNQFSNWMNYSPNGGSSGFSMGSTMPKTAGLYRYNPKNPNNIYNINPIDANYGIIMEEGKLAKAYPEIFNNPYSPYHLNIQKSMPNNKYYTNKYFNNGSKFTLEEWGNISKSIHEDLLLQHAGESNYARMIHYWETKQKLINDAINPNYFEKYFSKKGINPLSELTPAQVNELTSDCLKNKMAAKYNKVAILIPVLGTLMIGDAKLKEFFIWLVDSIAGGLSKEQRRSIVAGLVVISELCIVVVTRKVWGLIIEKIFGFIEKFLSKGFIDVINNYAKKSSKKGLSIPVIEELNKESTKVTNSLLAKKELWQKTLLNLERSSAKGIWKGICTFFEKLFAKFTIVGLETAADITTGGIGIIIAGGIGALYGALDYKSAFELVYGTKVPAELIPDMIGISAAYHSVVWAIDLLIIIELIFDFAVNFLQEFKILDNIKIFDTPIPSGLKTIRAFVVWSLLIILNSKKLNTDNNPAINVVKRIISTTRNPFNAFKNYDKSQEKLENLSQNLSKQRKILTKEGQIISATENEIKHIENSSIFADMNGRFNAKDPFLKRSDFENIMRANKKGRVLLFKKGSKGYIYRKDVTDLAKNEEDRKYQTYVIADKNGNNLIYNPFWGYHRSIDQVVNQYMKKDDVLGSIYNGDIIEATSSDGEAFTKFKEERLFMNPYFNDLKNKQIENRNDFKSYNTILKVYIQGILDTLKDINDGSINPSNELKKLTNKSPDDILKHVSNQYNKKKSEYIRLFAENEGSIFEPLKDYLKSIIHKKDVRKAFDQNSYRALNDLIDSFGSDDNAANIINQYNEIIHTNFTKRFNPVNKPQQLPQGGQADYNPTGRINAAKKSATINSIEPEKKQQNGTITYASPLANSVLNLTSPFGYRWGGSDFHTGVDFGADPGTDITAPSDGVVVDNAPESVSAGYGNFLAYLDKSGKMFFGFGHMNRPSSLHIGEEIKQGQKIGEVGFTGHCVPKGPAGSHLHFEVVKRLNSSTDYWQNWGGKKNPSTFYNPEMILKNIDPNAKYDLSYDNKGDGSVSNEELASNQKTNPFSNIFNKKMSKFEKIFYNSSIGKLFTAFDNLFGGFGNGYNSQNSSNTINSGGISSYGSGSFNATEGKSNRDKLYMLLRNKGFSPQAAIGVLANIQAESSFNTEAISGDGYHSVGICQWTDDRETNLYNFAKKHGKSPNDLELQFNYLMHEFSQYPSLMNLKNTNDAGLMAETMCIDFERPADKYYRAQERRQMAIELTKPLMNLESKSTDNKKPSGGPSEVQAANLLRSIQIYKNIGKNRNKKISNITIPQVRRKLNNIHIPTPAELFQLQLDSPSQTEYNFNTNQSNKSIEEKLDTMISLLTQLIQTSKEGNGIANGMPNIISGILNLDKQKLSDEIQKINSKHYVPNRYVNKNNVHGIPQIIVG